jgi:hypothetical protein
MNSPHAKYLNTIDLYYSMDSDDDDELPPLDCFHITIGTLEYINEIILYEIVEYVCNGVEFIDNFIYN